MILLIPFSMNFSFNSSKVAVFSTAMISVRGIIQSRTLMLEKSSTFWNILISVSISSVFCDSSMLFWMKESKSTFVKALAVLSLLLLIPNMCKMPFERNDIV